MTSHDGMGTGLGAAGGGVMAPPHQSTKDGVGRRRARCAEGLGAQGLRQSSPRRLGAGDAGSLGVEPTGPRRRQPGWSPLSRHATCGPPTRPDQLAGVALQHRLADTRQPDQPDAVVLVREQQDAPRVALAGLSELEWATVLAHEVKGIDTATIAEADRSTAGAVAARLARRGPSFGSTIWWRWSGSGFQPRSAGACCWRCRLATGAASTPSAPPTTCWSAAPVPSWRALSPRAGTRPVCFTPPEHHAGGLWLLRPLLGARHPQTRTG